MQTTHMRGVTVAAVRAFASKQLSLCDEPACIAAVPKLTRTLHSSTTSHVSG